MLARKLRGRSALLLALWLFISALTYLSSHGLKSDILHHLPWTRGPPHPTYRPRRAVTPPIVDNFPLAASAQSSLDLPPVPTYNQPPNPHVPENTPLFIGFTRNWLLLQQTVVSYITAGWPPEDIYVVENTGTMSSNKNSRLTLQNPFYLDYNRLTKVYGVNVISTPTYLTFTQLQNFYLNVAIEKEWDYYFWGHMDVVAISEEDHRDPDTGKYASLYERTVKDLRHTLSPDYAVDQEGRPQRWATKFYAYDRMALVNRHAYEEVGGWDFQIPYYGSDCDMTERLAMAGFWQEDVKTGLIYDIGAPLDDLLVLYRRKAPHRDATLTTSTDPVEPQISLPPVAWGSKDDQSSPTYFDLTRLLHTMQTRKNNDIRGRNVWQASQTGGQGEPFYRDPEGFDKAIKMTIEFGRTVMSEKWGHRGCDLRANGLGLGDEWRVERDSYWND
jgi:hypothetical protein